MSSLNEESVEKKLKTVNNTQDSIQSLSLWIIHHKTHHAKIVQLWMKVLKRSVHPSHRLTLLYLCNDVVQTCKKKKAHVYVTTFKEHLPEAARLVRDISVKGKVERIFNIWQERGVFDSSFVTSLNAVLSGKPFKAPKPNANDPISPVASPYEPTIKEDTPEIQTPAEQSTEDDIDDSTRILAEFKPHEMIEQITAFRRQELEIQIKFKQLSHLRLDASSLEAVKQLKDRTHGNEFSNQFEDSCTKLEDLVKRQSQHLADQKGLLETLKTSETFYDAQYREARIVANAYKNFGARINNMKKKLDEMKKTMPKPESPIPSPDINAPSPENSPPTYLGSRASYDYNASNSMLGFQGSGNQRNNWKLNGKDPYSLLGSNMDNTHQDSPPLEAPSPEGSPTDLNLDGSETGNASLDSRLASFMDRNHRGSDSSNKPPLYMPTSLVSQRSSGSPSHSNNKQSHSSRLAADEDGNNTPLDDEAPTTPVQDEHLTTPPKKNTTPPKKENPIDFLSRLISQTQNTPTTKTRAASFLDSLTMLGTVAKSSSSSSLTSSTSLKTSSESDPMVSSHQQHQQVPPPPRPWLWNSSTASIASQPSSPAIMSSQPSSPTTLFSRPPPTMVPPPPIPPIPIVAPPPVIPTQISPPVSINLSVPPPPPPPFSLVRGTSIDFNSPPPPFQQTSPGQKENWPEKGSCGGGIGHPDHSTTVINRSSSASSSSVLMELTPSEDFDEMSHHSNPHPMPGVDDKGEHDAMEIVSDDEEELDALMKDSDSDLEHEAHEEFASKLKEKTANGSGGGDASNNLKSSIVVPNANLVTVSVSDDMDEDERVVEKGSPTGDSVESSTHWPSSKSHKKKSSRSRSRSRDRSSHKHKKKKKHKRKGSDDDGLDLEGRTSAKKISSRSSGSRNSKDNKYDRDRYSDERGSKYEDKYSSSSVDHRGKYDRYEDTKYSTSSGSRGGGGDNKSSSYQAMRDPRDLRSAEEYTKAFIQQYSQARFGSSGYGGGGGGGHSADPRRPSGYSKY